MLRILSMLMICIHHTIFHGMRGADPILSAYSQFNAVITDFIYLFTICAVNCYALISGYVGADTKWKLSNILKLWIEVCFYNVVIMLIMLARGVQDIDTKQILLSFLPVISGRYWYFTAYFGMYFLMPVFNAAVNNMSQKQMKILLAGIFVAFTVIPMQSSGEIFGLAKGYSCIWLMLMYISGACIKKLKLSDRLCRHGLSAYIILLGAVFLASEIADYLLKHMGFNFKTFSLFNRYTSPNIYIAAILLLLYFSRLQPSGRLQKLTALLAPMTFGVYLIHDNKFIRTQLIKGSFSGYIALSPPLMLIAVLGTAAAIYLLCSAIDWLRIKLFGALRINAFCSFVDDRLLNGLSKLL